MEDLNAKNSSKKENFPEKQQLKHRVYFFSPFTDHHVYCYDIPENKWLRLPLKPSQENQENSDSLQKEPEKPKFNYYW